MATVIKEFDDEKPRIRVRTAVNNFGFMAASGPGVDKPRSKGEKIFKIAVECDKAEQKSLNDIIQKFWDDNKPARNKSKEPDNTLIYQSEKDKKFYIAPYTQREDQDGEVRNIAIVDAKRNPLDPKKYGQGGKGTTGCVVFDLVIWGDAKEAGVSAYLRSVQLQHFEPYTGGGNVSDDYEEIEGEEMGDGSDYAEPEKGTKGSKNDDLIDDIEDAIEDKDFEEAEELLEELGEDHDEYSRLSGELRKAKRKAK